MPYYYLVLIYIQIIFRLIYLFFSHFHYIFLPKTQDLNWNKAVEGRYNNKHLYQLPSTQNKQ